MRLVVSFLLISVAFSGLNAAEIYRHVDENGNVKFSDQPKDGAKRVEVAPPNIDASPKAPKARTKSDNSEEEASPYTSLALVEPENDITLHQVSEVKLVASVTPALRSGHSIQFFRNGAPLGEPSRDITYTAPTLERGSYSFSVKVLDSTGETLLASDQTVVHIRRQSILHPNSQN